MLLAANHTFLFHAAVWEMKGTFFDEKGIRHRMEGITRVEHKQNVWFHDLMMKVCSKEEKRIFNFSEVKPIDGNEGYSVCKSQNPDVGSYNGILIVQADDIFMSWVAPDGKFSGTNHIHMLDKQNYTQYGYVFNGTHRVSSWKVKLKRV